MNKTKKLDLAGMDVLRTALIAKGVYADPWYGGPLRRHLKAGDDRLRRLRYDGSAASFRLWDFFLTEEERLKHHRDEGRKIVGTMKDLGTVSVMAYSHPNLVAFCPDGAWWIPCVMMDSQACLHLAETLGADDSMCPVRAMLGAFLNRKHFPTPDVLTCSTGAVCDDFASISQSLASAGHPVLWWEVPYRRPPDPDEEMVSLLNGFQAPRSQIDFLVRQLALVRGRLSEVAGGYIDDEMLARSVKEANSIRRLISDFREVVFRSDPAPFPALEELLVEMFAPHFCSDLRGCREVLVPLLAEAKRRSAAGVGHGEGNARIFWINPVADLFVMNLVEDCGGRICGTDYMVSHAFGEIPEEVPPLEGLAVAALSDTMVGAASDRAAYACREARRWGAEGVIVSRIPGASHCAIEGHIIAENVRRRVDIPVVELEVPSVADGMASTLRTRIEALVETIRARRRRGK